MRQWLMSILLLGVSLPTYALQFGPQTSSKLKPLDDIALVINDEAISRQQLAAELAQARRSLPKKLPASEALQKELLNRVIMHHLLRQLQARLDIHADTADIDRTIAGIAAQNHLSPAALYTRVKRATGLSRDAYRAQIAQNIAQDKLRQAFIGQNMPISEADINAQVAQILRQDKNATVELQDLLLPVPTGNALERGKTIKQEMHELSSALKASDGDLAQAASRIPQARLVDLGRVHIAQLPQRFANAIVNLPTGKILDAPVIDKDGMHFLRVNARHTAKTINIPEADVQHILLRVADKNEIGAQKAIIDAIYQQLQQGADFATLARQYSQDPQSAARGGELGWMGADQVVPAFAKTMLSIPLNTISKPFLTPYGWHIIRVSARRNLDRSADILRARVREQLLNKYLNDAWQRRLTQLRQQAYIELR